MSYYFVAPYSSGWYLVLGVFLLISATTLVIGRFIRETFRNRLLRFIGFYLLIDMIFLQGYLLYGGSYSLKTCLPLAYCSIMQLVASIAAITRKRFFYEVALLFGITGPIQAFISPAVACQGEEYIFLDYFVSHGLTIIVPLFILIGNRVPLRPYAFFKASIFMQLCIFLVYLIDIVIGANYMYLVERPPIAHPLNYGKWPFYLVYWHGVFYMIAYSVAITSWFRRWIHKITVKNIV